MLIFERLEHLQKSWFFDANYLSDSLAIPKKNLRLRAKFFRIAHSHSRSHSHSLKILRKENDPFPDSHSLRIKGNDHHWIFPTMWPVTKTKQHTNGSWINFSTTFPDSHFSAMGLSVRITKTETWTGNNLFLQWCPLRNREQKLETLMGLVAPQGRQRLKICYLTRNFFLRCRSASESVFARIMDQSFQGFTDSRNLFSDAEVLKIWQIYVLGVTYLTNVLVCVMYVMMYVVCAGLLLQCQSVVHLNNPSRIYGTYDRSATR